MREDEKMYRIGKVAIGAVFILTAGLQVCYRTQNRALDNVRREIVRTQQEIAMAEANFASYVRPEILRSMVMTVAPQSESISFNKTVAIGQLSPGE